MAGELRATTNPRVTSAGTYYMFLWNAVGQIYRTDTKVFEAYNTANIANYAIAATQQGTASGIYLATMPTAANGGVAGVYSFELYKQVGGGPSETDTFLASGGVLPWTGSVVSAGEAYLPQAAAGASGGLPTLNSALNVNADVQKWVGSTPNALISGRVDANTQATAASLTFNLTGNITGNLSGSVGSVTGAVTLSAGDSPVIQTGTATAGSSTSITIQTALGADFISNGCKVKITSGTGAGQCRVISNYTNATKVVTVYRNWTTNPDATSVYAILYDDAPLNTSNLAAQADLQTIKTQTVTCAAGVTILANVGFAGAPGAANGGLIGGSNAATTFASLTVTGAFLVSGGATYTNATGDGFVCSSTGNNGRGVFTSGNGTGDGWKSVGGATGDGIHAACGASGGFGILGEGAGSAGIRGICTGGNGSGIEGLGSGTGDGIAATGGATGRGMHLIGGATSGAGMRIEGTAGNANALETFGQGSGDGWQTTAGVTGRGIHAIGGATSGEAFYGQTTNADAFSMNASGASHHGIVGTGGSGSSHGIFGQGGDNGNGIQGTGAGSGDGIAGTGGTTGNGLHLLGGATSGHGLLAAPQGTGTGVTTDSFTCTNAFTVSGTTTLTGAVTATNAGNDIRGITVSAGTVTTVTGNVAGKVLGGGAGVLVGVGAEVTIDPTLFPTNFSHMSISAGGVVDANIVQVKGLTVKGTGTSADPWGPA